MRPQDVGWTLGGMNKKHQVLSVLYSLSRFIIIGADTNGCILCFFFAGRAWILF